MKVADYVAQFIKQQAVQHVFGVTGGAALHLLDSVGRLPGVECICTQHEQAAAMAADAYARISGNLGVAIATSGPGATNMLTGCCCAYYDSVPVLYITGQVSTFRLKRDTGVRQLGFQETDVVDIFRPVTKYAVLVENSLNIRFELEKAAYIARAGRPGPVLVDIPDNIQRMEVEPDVLEGFHPDAGNEEVGLKCVWEEEIQKLLSSAERPVVIAGWGVHLAGAEREMLDLIERLGFPVLPTWGAVDLIPTEHPLLVGPFGLHGTRYGNFAVQNADLVLAVGTRLDTHLTGTPVTNFARAAKKIFVDVDLCELNKFKEYGLKIDLPIQADAKVFLQSLLRLLPCSNNRDYSAWFESIRNWRQRYPICPGAYYQEEKANPYVFVKTLSQEMPNNASIFIDTGCGVAWMTQAFEIKKGQRLFSAFNNTPMGYALPAAIGAAFALGNYPVICVAGDGGLQMSLQELVTVIRHKLPLKIFLLNNHGYSMIQQTQEQWLDARYIASTIAGGLAFPDFVRLAEAYGFHTVNIVENAEMAEKIAEALAYQGPVFCNIEIDPKHRVIPQVVFGRPIEDAGPLLSREEFLQQMVISPLEESLR